MGYLDDRITPAAIARDEASNAAAREALATRRREWEHDARTAREDELRQKRARFREELRATARRLAAQEREERDIYRAETYGEDPWSAPTEEEVAIRERLARGERPDAAPDDMPGPGASAQEVADHMQATLDRIKGRSSGGARGLPPTRNVVRAYNLGEHRR